MLEAVLMVQFPLKVKNSALEFEATGYIVVLGPFSLRFDVRFLAVLERESGLTHPEICGSE